MVDKGKAYSIYGPLDIQKTPNYIRIHDTNDLLNPDLTKDLGVHVTMTNLNTGVSQLLNDEVRIFDSLYTHNFEIPDSIEYDTKYKFLLEDEDGYRDSLISVTTKETELTIIQDSVSCGELFMLRFTDIDLDAGERIQTEVGIKVGVAWMYTKRPANLQDYNSATNTLILGWSPNYVSELIYGPFDWVSCRTFSSDKIRFSFTHIGYMEEASFNSPNEIEFDQLYTPNQVVLSKYMGDTEVTIDSSVFN
jgi:hypothetical protein